MCTGRHSEASQLLGRDAAVGTDDELPTPRRVCCAHNDQSSEAGVVDGGLARASHNVHQRWDEEESHRSTTVKVTGGTLGTALTSAGRTWSTLPAISSRRPGGLSEQCQGLSGPEVLVPPQVAHRLDVERLLEGRGIPVGDTGEGAHRLTRGCTPETAQSRRTTESWRWPSVHHRSAGRCAPNRWRPVRTRPAPGLAGPRSSTAGHPHPGTRWTCERGRLFGWWTALRSPPSARWSPHRRSALRSAPSRQVSAIAAVRRGAASRHGRRRWRLRPAAPSAHRAAAGRSLDERSWAEDSRRPSRRRTRPARHRVSPGTAPRTSAGRTGWLRPDEPSGTLPCTTSICIAAVVASSVQSATDVDLGIRTRPAVKSVSAG